MSTFELVKSEEFCGHPADIYRNGDEMYMTIKQFFDAYKSRGHGMSPLLLSYIM